MGPHHQQCFEKDSELEDLWCWYENTVILRGSSFKNGDLQGFSFKVQPRAANLHRGKRYYHTSSVHLKSYSKDWLGLFEKRTRQKGLLGIFQRKPLVCSYKNSKIWLLNSGLGFSSSSISTKILAFSQKRKQITLSRVGKTQKHTLAKTGQITKPVG